MTEIETVGKDASLIDIGDDLQQREVSWSAISINEWLPDVGAHTRHWGVLLLGRTLGESPFLGCLSLPAGL